MTGFGFAGGAQLRESPVFLLVGFEGVWVACCPNGLLELAGLVELEKKLVPVQCSVVHWAVDCAWQRVKGRGVERERSSSFGGVCSSRVMHAVFLSASLPPGAFLWSL